MKRGFTLLELMVASLLLGMLVSALTMLFNASAIAWRTGVASVADLKDVRAELGAMHNIEDDLIPGVNGDPEPTYRIVSVWDQTAENALRSDRAFTRTFSWGRAAQISLNEAEKGVMRTLNAAGNGNASEFFSVGVRSAGPDRKMGTGDDISTWPE